MKIFALLLTRLAVSWAATSLTPGTLLVYSIIFVIDAGLSINFKLYKNFE